MHEKMADSVEVGTSDECPSVQRLRHWLDGRAQLDASETTHVRQCEKCQSHLERFTSASDLDGSGGVKLDAKNDFAGEPALAEVQRDLATQPNTPNTLHETMEETPSQVDSQQQSHARTSVGAPNTSWLNEHFDPERYTLEGVIGRGGNADVFKIYDALLDRHFAIKTIASDHDRARLRMLREAKLLAEIDHVNILRVFDVGQVDDTDGQPAIYICMEYMAGGTLGDFFKVAPSGPADFLSLAGLLAGVCDGLALAHDKGIVHRDLKPANILLDEKGEIAKLADFGLATRDSDFQTMLTRTGAIVGTPAFMSPEQASASESIGPGSDVYAIGATLYFMLTRQVPFTGNPAAVARQIIDSDPVSPSVLNEKAPRELVAICERAMEKEPSKRYASSAELAQDFRAFVAGKQVSAKPISSLGKVSRQLRRDRKLYLAIQAAGWLAAALLILAVGSAIVFRRQSSQLAQAAERERADQQRLRKSLERSIEAADQLLVSVTEDLSLLPSSPGSDRISNTLLLRARDYYQKFLTENAGNDQLQFQLARAHSGLARIAYRRGELKQGMQQTQNAKDLLAGIERSGESEQAVEVDLLMARLLLEQGTSQGKADPSDADADQALADCITLTSDLAERAEGSNQSDTSVDFGLEARSLLTSALRNRSVMLGRIGHDDLAGELAREAVASGSKLVATDGASGRALLASALANQTLGLYQMQHQEFQLGEATVEQALATLERIEEAERVALRTASVEANLHSNLARIAMMKGELDKATEEQQVAIEIHERMCAIEPDVPSHRSDLVDVLLNATNIEYAAERFERVIEVSQKAIDILSGLILLDEGNPEHLQTKAMLQGNIAIVQLHLGNPLLSIQPLTESLADLQRAAEQLNHAPSAQVAIALNHYSLAGAYYDLGQFDEALKSLDRSDKITADVLAEQPDFDQAIDHMIDSIFRRTDVLLEIQPVDTQQIIDCIAKADRLSDKLIAAAPDVIEYSARKLLMVTTRGEAKRIAGDLDAAIADADSILATAKELRPEDYEEMLTDVLQYTYLLRHDVLTDKLDATEGSDARGRLESERAKARKMAEQYGAPEEEFAIDER